VARLIRAASAAIGGFKQNGVDRDKAQPVFDAYTDSHTNWIPFRNPVVPD
jgi:hypothetical protein